MHTWATTETEKSLQPAYRDQPVSGPRTGIQSAPPRLASLDAYRGLIMLLMATDGLGLADYVKSGHRSAVARLLEFNFEHVPWCGCAMWDLIQPSFIFIVGVAIPYSLARRRLEGESFARLFAHALFRSIMLIGVGIFLRSIGEPRTYFTFEDTLTQIGLAYPFAFLLAWAKPRWQFAAIACILLGYWLVFALYPLPPVGFNYATVGVDRFWRDHLSLHGFAAHWNRCTNAAAAFDVWFRNLFPHVEPFVFNRFGYQTLNFVPSIATMTLGLLASNLMRGDQTPRRKILCLAAAAGVGFFLALALDEFGVCPIVKHIWTPAWVLFSGAWACLFLATFYAIVDCAGYRRLAFPLIVVGMNSIAIYGLAHPWFTDMIHAAFHTHLGPRFFATVAGDFAPIAESAATVAVLWLIAFWIYRKKLFLRI